MQIEDDMVVHAVVNGGLGMSEGKGYAQVFQACQRLYAAAREDEQLAQRLLLWEEKKTKTVVYLAKNHHVFNRCQTEAKCGVTMVDEGVNEVPEGSATIWASWPITRAEYPQILKHKNIRILKPPVLFG
jgi:peptidyl-tRNA hydrolase